MTRRFLVPEVIQTSATDCGPAALKALFAGFHRYLSYGRLREACQTDVDGTSIDTLETIGTSLGLELQQRMLPADMLLLPSSEATPAIVVVRLPDGGTHFVVLWRIHRRMVQVMDPAGGRVWMDRRRFLDWIHLHEQRVARDAWEAWARTPMFRDGLERRMRAIGISGAVPDDRTVGDAALRLASVLVDAGVLRRGRDARELVDLCTADPSQIPDEYWTARAIDSEPDFVTLRGAVVLTASGRSDASSPMSLPPSLAAVAAEPPPHIWAPVWSAVAARGWASLAIVAAALVCAAAGTVVEALLFRALVDAGRHFSSVGQRVAVLAFVAALSVVIIALEWSAASGLRDFGRQVELRLRAQFLLKVPRLGDRYFQSRLVSDMAFRAHTLHLLRQAPELAGEAVRLAAALLFTTAAVAWLYPSAAGPAALACAIAVGTPLLFQPMLVERDLRVRETTASLTRFVLDVLRGAAAVRAHAAESTVLAVQARQLRGWADAGLRSAIGVVTADALQLGAALASIVWLVALEARRGERPAGLLLLAYWAISISSYGQQLGAIAWTWPALRNTLVRFLEPIGAPDEAVDVTEGSVRLPAAGVSIDMLDVSVVAAGSVVLDSIDLTISSGEHVAIVGASGAGKSSLAGVLLGWHQPATGQVLADGQPLDGARLVELRRQTAWIDPQVHLFRGTLFDNLRFGNGDDAPERIEAAIDGCGLMDLLKRLPDGLRSAVGEGGTRLSSADAQRVRFARAFCRPDVRLAVLDEAARGFDRHERLSLMASARRRFRQATLLAIMHDVSDTIDFDRVLVMERGRIVEQGAPRRLAQWPGSRYRGLLEDEEAARQEWEHPRWRRLRMADGCISETAEEPVWMRV